MTPEQMHILALDAKKLERGLIVNDNQKAAYIQAQCVCAMAEIEGMKAENQSRTSLGFTASYSESDFFAVPAKYGLGHNDASLFYAAD
jgi:hypothetical protein